MLYNLHVPESFACMVIKCVSVCACMCMCVSVCACMCATAHLQSLHYQQCAAQANCDSSQRIHDLIAVQQLITIIN